jgi:hypothetical protein
VLCFENESAYPCIVPSHAAYVVRRAAQDHAMMGAGLVPSKARKSFDTAACIQERQGGYVPMGSHRMVILPHPLRQPALERRAGHDYSKLWPAIRSFNQSMGVTRSAAHLEYFLGQYQAELAQFVAQFEYVPRQVGAIVLINGFVVGIERTPSRAYWRDVWPGLIRGCYGALALHKARELGDRAAEGVMRFREPLACQGEALADLERALERTERHQDAKVRQLIRNLVVRPLQRQGKLDEAASGLYVETWENAQLVGQTVRKQDARGRVIYASFVSRAEWLTDPGWAEAKPFVI